MSQQKWFYKKSGNEHGPISAKQLKKLAAVGEIEADDQVRSDSMKKWVRASSVKGLLNKAKAPTEPPPLPKTDSEFPEKANSGDSIVGRLKRSSANVANATRAAGVVVARQAEMTRIKTIDLPRNYVGLGREIRKQGLVRSELPQVHEQIEMVGKQISENAEAANQIDGSSAKGMAQKAKLKAKAKALQLQQSKFLRALGEKAFAIDEVQTACEQPIAEIVKLRERVKQLESETEQIESESRSPIFTPKRIAFAMVACIGLVLLSFVVSFVQSVTESFSGERVAAVSEVSDFDFSDVDYSAVPSGATATSISREVEEGEGLDELVGSPLEANGYRTANGDFVHHGKQTIWTNESKETVRCESWFYEGKQHGPYLRWHKDGNKAVVAAIVDGQWHGVATRWSPEGIVVERTPYRNGAKHGMDQKFFADGSPLEEASFKDGEPHGAIKQWHDSNQVAVESGFIEGKKHGKITFWDRDGNVILEGSCDNGLPKGEWKFPFDDRHTREQYFVYVYSEPWHGGTIAEFICKLRLLLFIEDWKTSLFPREGRGSGLASSVDLFQRIVGVPDSDLTRDPGTSLESSLRWWSYRCSDGVVTLQIAIDPRMGHVNWRTVNE